MMNFWPKEALKKNGLYNTQFRTENVIPNQDLMQKAVLNKKLLNLCKNAGFKHKIM